MPTINRSNSTKILVTGGSGYIGPWVIHYLLEEGFSVRAVVRSEAKAGPLRRHFGDTPKLEFAIVGDFLKDGAFDNALDGVQGIIHLASPMVPSAVDPDEIIKPAVNGTLNLLKSASLPTSSIKRIVMTSSTAAVSQSDTVKTPTVFSETDWSSAPEMLETYGENARNAPFMLKYRTSKTLAEKAAWDFAGAKGKERGWDLVTFTPPFVLGPSLIKECSAGTSVEWWFNSVVKDGPKDAETLGTAISYVDVRDVARAHVMALTNEQAGGERFILTAGATTWQEAIENLSSLKDLAALKEPKTKGIPNLEKKPYQYTYNPEKSKRVLGIEYRKYEDTVRDMVKDLSERGY